MCLNKRIQDLDYSFDHLGYDIRALHAHIEMGRLTQGQSCACDVWWPQPSQTQQEFLGLKA